MEQFSCPLKVQSFYEDPELFSSVDLQQPWQILHNANMERVVRDNNFLDAASDEERRAYYKQPPFKAGGKRDLKHIKTFSDEQIFKKILEIHAVTGKWLMKSDVEDEKEFRRLNKIANLTWGELVEITHLLLVVGRMAP
jgi:hypothetical protein